MENNLPKAHHGKTRSGLQSRTQITFQQMLYFLTMCQHWSSTRYHLAHSPCPDLLRAFLVLALEVPCPMKPLSPGQTGWLLTLNEPVCPKEKKRLESIWWFLWGGIYQPTKMAISSEAVTSHWSSTENWQTHYQQTSFEFRKFLFLSRRWSLTVHSLGTHLS